MGMTFAMSLEINAKKKKSIILYQHLTDRTRDLINSSEEEIQVLYIYTHT